MVDLVEEGLMEMGLHLLPRHKPWLKNRFTWIMQQYRQEFQSQTDYILGTDCRLFRDVAVRDTRNHLDYYMVLGCLRGEPVKELTGYLLKARRFPFRPLRRDLASAPDKIF